MLALGAMHGFKLRGCCQQPLKKVFPGICSRITSPSRRSLLHCNAVHCRKTPLIMIFQCLLGGVASLIGCVGSLLVGTSLVRDPLLNTITKDVCVCAFINSWRFQNCQKVSHRSAEVGTSLQVLLRALLKGRGTSSLMPV